MKYLLTRVLTLFSISFIFMTNLSAAASETKTHTEKVTLGGGCFWCLEAFFEKFEGVDDVVSGYAGGKKENPTYEQVCGGNTGHAEVVQIEFNPKKISLKQILEIFWEMHDPTTLNRQGNDSGTQYRSIIFYNNEEQKAVIEQSKAEAAKKYSQPIVTEIAPLTKFYAAEDYHQDYFRKNPHQPYCAFVISPKLKKLQKVQEKLGLSSQK